MADGRGTPNNLGRLSYQLEQITAPNTWKVVATQSGTSFSVTGMVDGYWGYRVKACRAGNVCGYYSNPFTQSVAHTPPPPLGLNTTPNPSSGAFTIAWSASPGATWYKLEEKTNGAEWVALEEGYLTATSLAATRGNGSYVYRVSACALMPPIRCSVPSEEVTENVQGSAIPGTPTSISGPTGCAASPRTYTISWSPVGTATSYDLHEKNDLTGLDQVLVSTTPYQNLTRQKGAGFDTSQYAYEVRACSGSGAGRLCSPYKGTVEVCVGNPRRPAIADPVTTSYDAFGQARAGNFAARPGGLLNLLPDTLRGFTGHEHVDDVRLIHMNGRVYDYQLGRFLSVDPVIGNPKNSQSLNPYSYIGNNPLSGKDPTGYVACTGSHTDRGNDAGDCADQGVSTIWVNPSSSGPGRNGAARQGATGHSSSASASDLGSTKEPVDHCASGPLTCHKEQYNGTQQPTDLGPVSSHEIDGAGFINGITGDTDRHADLGAKHLRAELNPMPLTFTLIDSPSAGPLGDVAKIGLTQIGLSKGVAKQLAGILLDVQHDGHHLDLVCHSGGCAELKAAIRYAFASTHESLTSIRASFHAGANNIWLTNGVLDRAGVARFGGINAPGYRYNPHDMVPQVVGGNALLHPVDMMMSIWNAPKLFSGDEHLSPHTLPYRSDERLP